MQWRFGAYLTFKKGLIHAVFSYKADKKQQEHKRSVGEKRQLASVSDYFLNVRQQARSRKSMKEVYVLHNRTRFR